MKRTINTFCGAVCVILTMLLGSCTDPKSVIDTNTAITDHNWSYVNRVKFDCKIDDEKAAYNLYMNLRVTDAYKYANLFVLIYQTAPGSKAKVTRYELKLANPDGEWLGKGSGNLYSYQVPFRTNIKFPAKGNYHFEIEQNMRDNPLHEVSDVGLRVEKAQ
ncbi:gliding motility-associated lipoprotein GldH [Mucilaginibacter pineti]|uniref:Gliding motility-associated lipoprotein GldH n=1 Tax=Mucilaginibacter pineti TaxID=1391627 RepID=A0A1G7FMN5_9SPHI|nr:gliding motility lipoprotein GldH [Mucilaginibacter pineti]SDE77068.1 gliding motility-associated lipoprotein GldH [Mucilaginibacter pineti]